MSKVSQSYKLIFDTHFSEDHLLKGIFLVVLHASRTPPHIGLIADQQYHSLTIKGQEIRIPVEVLIRNCNQRKIPSLFIKIKRHPVFSTDYLKEHFISNVQQFPIVDIGIATCLSPVKLFFEEVYGVPVKNVNYLYQLIPQLDSQGLIENTSSLFIDEKKYKFPIYTQEEINKEIELARTDFKVIRSSLSIKTKTRNKPEKE